MLARRVEPTESETMPIFRFLVSQTAEAARFPVDEDRSTREFWRIMNSGPVYVAEKDGVVVGSLALREAPVSWYSPSEMVWMVDEWFVVDPGFRISAATALLRLARDEGGGKPIVVRVVHNKRGPEHMRILGFDVIGNIVTLR